jgi:DNA-binding NarL/FixJ family response regulator
VIVVDTTGQSVDVPSKPRRLAYTYRPRQKHANRDRAIWTLTSLGWTSQEVADAVGLEERSIRRRVALLREAREALTEIAA